MQKCFGLLFWLQFVHLYINRNKLPSSIKIPKISEVKVTKDTTVLKKFINSKKISTKLIKQVDSHEIGLYLIKNKTNIGLTAGLNIGYKFSVNQNYDYIARIDCDFIITKNYLKGMVDTFENQKNIAEISQIKIYVSLLDFFYLSLLLNCRL